MARPPIPKESISRMVKKQGAELVARDASAAMSAYAEGRIAEITKYALEQTVDVKKGKKLMYSEMLFAIKKNCKGIGEKWMAPSETAVVKPAVTGKPALRIGAVRGIMEKAGASLVSEKAVYLLIDYMNFELSQIFNNAVEINAFAKKKKITKETFDLAKSQVIGGPGVIKK